MSILTDLLSLVPDAPISDVTIGIHWTAVSAVVNGKIRCGLASTLMGSHPHGVVDVPSAGSLQQMSGHQLASLAVEHNFTLRSIGVAAINALIPRQPDRWIEHNAGDAIAKAGANKNVVLVGHFPFIPDLHQHVGQLNVLEMNPGPGEHPVEATDVLVPQADVFALTSMTLLNGTFDGLMALRKADARVFLIGPSTPMHPLLFEYGVEMLLGSIVTHIDPVLALIRQGAVFRQVHKAGIRLVAMT